MQHWTFWTWMIRINFQLLKAQPTQIHMADCELETLKDIFFPCITFDLLLVVRQSTLMKLLKRVSVFANLTGKRAQETWGLFTLSDNLREVEK